MEVEKLSDFLENCCRICLSIENEMVESTNIVENFNKSIEELLLECVNLKVICLFCIFLPKQSIISLSNQFIL